MLPQVDCTQEVALCREHLITGFPSIRVFRKGHDEVSTPFGKEHEAYRGGWHSCAAPQEANRRQACPQAVGIAPRLRPLLVRVLETANPQHLCTYHCSC